MKPALRPVTDPLVWAEQCRAFLDHNYRQLWAFGVACAARLGARSEHVALLEGGELLALADVRIKHLPVLGAGVAYVNGGPLVRRGDPRDESRLRHALAALKAEYVESRGLLLRVAPTIGEAAWNECVCRTFASLGFACSDDLRPYRTLLLDLRRPLDEIRKRLDQKWRNGLNRAERNALTLRSGTSADLFETFAGLYAALRERKGFDVELDAGFYAGVQPDLPAKDQLVVSLAEFNGRPVAGHLGSIAGDTSVYLLGASDPTGLEQKASYLLQWHALVAAHGRGCSWYDLGGIDPDGNPGVHHFKSGLGGADVTAPGPYEFAPTGVKRSVVRGAERVYRWVRRVVPRRARSTRVLPKT